MGYGSLDDRADPHRLRRRRRQESSGDPPPPPPPPPHLYPSPATSAALITAFGLPTLIECEVPPEPPPAPGPTAQGAGRSPPSSRTPEFSPVRSSRPSRARDRSLSLPLDPSLEAEGDDDEGPRPSGRAAPRRLSRSEHIPPGRPALASERSASHPAATFGAYAHRVRDVDGRHRLLLRRGGTSESMGGSDDDGFAEDDVPASDTGLLLTPQDALRGSSISAGAAAELEGAVRDLEKTAPGARPEVPAEVLDAEAVRTAPALKLWPLAVLVFYNVSGGPFGIEPSIRAGGNFYAILGFIIFPLIWSVPEALVTAELGAAFQDPSAGVAWVEEAFGTSLGSLCGYLAWVSGATDNAIYPTLFVEYLSSVAGWDQDDFSGATRFGWVAVITLVLAALNYTGLEIVGNASLFVCAIAMSPFIVLTIIAAPKVDPSRWLRLPEPPADGSDLFDDDFQTSSGPLPLLTLGGILWRPYLNNMFWNLNSFDSAGSFAGETSSPSTTYPRGIFIGLIMTVVGYIIPLMVAVGATDYDQADWVDGHLGAVAVDIGGKWLGGWTIFAAGISNLALFEAEMSSDAFQLMGMAERGYLPKIFTTRSKHGTPTAGILFNTCVIVAFSCADFGQLLELLNSVYALSLLMEYAAFVKLRLFHKDLERPYRVPVPDWAAVGIVIPPTLGILAIIATSNWFVYIFCAGAVVFGALIFQLSDFFKRRGWFEYASKDYSKNKYTIPPLEDDDVSDTSIDIDTTTLGNGENGFEEAGLM